MSDESEGPRLPKKGQRVRLCPHLAIDGLENKFAAWYEMPLPQKPRKKGTSGRAARPTSSAAKPGSGTWAGLCEHCVGLGAKHDKESTDPAAWTTVAALSGFVGTLGADVPA